MKNTERWEHWSAKARLLLAPALADGEGGVWADLGCGDGIFAFLLCQMLTQCLRSVCPKIVVEIPEPWFKHPNGNPGLGGSDGQSLRRASPRRIAVDGNVEALQTKRRVTWTSES